MPRRPKSVILLQILGTLLLLSFALGVIRTGIEFAGKGMETWSTFAVPVMLRLLVIGGLTWCQYALIKRQTKGRWLGLINIAGIFVMVFYAQFLNTSPHVLPRFEYSDPDYGLKVEKVTGGLQLIAIAAWAYFFGFGTRAREFFAGSADFR